MTDGIGIATREFASTVEVALQQLERRISEIGPHPKLGSFRHVVDGWTKQRDQAPADAAAAIFAAEDAFSRACLRELSAREDGPEAAVQSRQVGDAILRFAACGLRGLNGNHYNSDLRVRKLLDIARQVGEVEGGGSGSDRLVASPAGRIAPRMSPLG